MYIWFFDFDDTITIKDTIGSKESTATNLDNLSNLRLNIRNIAFLRGFFNSCAQKGDKIFLITKQTNKKLIGAYMHALLGEDWKNIINGMCCINGNLFGLPGKNGHIKKILQNHFSNTALPSIMDLNRKNCIVVEDYRKNCDYALEEGYQVVWAEKYKDNYLADLERIDQNRNLSASPLVFNQAPVHDFDRVIEFDEITDINSAKNFLVQRVFNLQQYHYENKATCTNAVELVFEQLINYQRMLPHNLKFSQTEIINQLCDLYDYITKPENKDKINIHKNPWLDNKLGIINTATWRNMVSVIREKSLNILFEEAEKLQSYISRADYLEDYCYRGLFAEHRSNGFFGKKEGFTKTVGKINQKIADYRQSAGVGIRRN